MTANAQANGRSQFSPADRADTSAVAAARPLFALDWAMDYLRGRMPILLPLYVLAMAPFSVALLWLFDAMTSGNRPAIFERCLALAVAALWRWAVLGRLQHRILVDLRGPAATPFRRRVAGIVLIRLAAAVIMGWGVFLLFIPSFFALFVAGCIAPLAMDEPENIWPLTRRLLKYVSTAVPMLAQMLLSFLLLVLVVVAATEMAQSLLVRQVLPSFFGLNTGGAAFTLGSGAWQLCLAYFFFVIFDFWWTVACVMVAEQLRARRTGSDMRLRLRQLKGAA